MFTGLTADPEWKLSGDEVEVVCVSESSRIRANDSTSPYRYILREAPWDIRED